MKVNILETGSAGNCILATYSDGRKVLFDFGHNAFKRCCEAGIDFHEVDDILVTHDHLDHCADYDRVRFLAFSRRLKVITFPVLHNAENKGFIVLNDAKREGFIYATDYYQLPDESIEKIKAMVKFTDWKWMAMLELSYVRWLYNKLDPMQMIGLNQHCSDERFFRYVGEILEVNPSVNIISVHASARQGEFVLGQGKMGNVCPPDDLQKQFYKRFEGKSVRFGYNVENGKAGMCRTYNYIDINDLKIHKNK